MDGAAERPTTGETTAEQRRLMVRLYAQGASYGAIAEQLGCSRWTVGRWVRAAAAGGEAALAYRSRRPLTPHPQTTPPAVQARIRAIRERHPGWGARLIRRQLELEGSTPVPSEAAIQRWLRTQGFALVRPLRHKSLGWPTPTAGAQSVWQVDFKQKGGLGT